ARFERVQGRVEDVLAERDRLARDEADEAGELIAIHFPPGEQPQHQEFGHTRHEGWSLRGHRCLPYLVARGMVPDPRRAQKFHTPVRRCGSTGQAQPEPEPGPFSVTARTPGAGKPRPALTRGSESSVSLPRR